jgi:preprotein translocase subunit SecA
MNKQREVIYKKRREILRSADTKSLTLDQIKEEIEKVVSLHSAAEEGQWNIAEMGENFNAILNTANPEVQKKIEAIRDDKKWNLSEKITEVNQYLFEMAKLAYNKKEQEISAPQMRFIEKAVMLQTIDINWMNHLDETDYLREGIGLRGYGQRDPLIEYKREAFDLFSNLMENVRSSIVRTIFRISLGVPAQESSQKKPALNYKGADDRVEQFSAAKKSDESAPEKSSPIINQNKVGRNDPCPCGSGKKYKKCCGK